MDKIVIRQKIVFFLFLSCLFVSIFSCQDESKSSETPAYLGAINEIYNLSLILSDSGKIMVRVKTPLQKVLSNEDRVFPSTIFIEFFDKKTQTVMTTLQSDSGRYIAQKKAYKISGNVVVISLKKKETLKSDSLYWFPELKKIVTDAPISIKTPSEIIKGIGLEATQDFSQYKIRKVSGVLSTKENFEP